MRRPTSTNSVIRNFTTVPATFGTIYVVSIVRTALLISEADRLSHLGCELWLLYLSLQIRPRERLQHLLYFEYERVSRTMEAQDSHICSTIPQRYQRSTQRPGDIPKASLFPDLACPGRKSPLPRIVPFHANSVGSIMAQSTGLSN